MFSNNKLVNKDLRQHVITRDLTCDFTSLVFNCVELLALISGINSSFYLALVIICHRRRTTGLN